MRAGALDRRVKIEQRLLTTGGTGEPVESWEFVADRWMAKRDIRATESFTGNERLAEAETVWRGRYHGNEAWRPDSHRIVHRNRVYQILGVTELGRRDALEFACAARGETAYG